MCVFCDSFLCSISLLLLSAFLSCILNQGRHRFNTNGGAILENYTLHGADRPKVNTCSLDGSRKSSGAMPSNSKSGGAKAPPAPPSVSPLTIIYM